MLTLSAVLVGVLVSGFLYLASRTIHFMEEVSEASLKIFSITVVLTVVISIPIVLINNKVVSHIGSGIHVLEEYYDEDKNFNPFINMSALVINSYLAFFQGFTLGSEAPSVFIGAAAGKMTGMLFKREDKDVVCASASAGFAVAFLAPAAGLLHLIEEHTKRVNVFFVLKGLYVIALSTLLSYFMLPRHLFSAFEMKWLPIKYYYVIVIVSLFATLLGALYRLMHKYVGALSKFKNIMLYITPVLGLGFMLLNRYYPILSGNGDYAAENNLFDYGILVLFLVMLGRLCLMILSESSYVSGGSVLPLLALGAILGEIIIIVFSHMKIDLSPYRYLIKMVAMCTVLGVGASIPLSSLVLGIELTKSALIMLPITISIILAYFFKKLINVVYYRNAKKREIFVQNDAI